MGIREIKLGPKSPLVDRAAAGLLEAARGAPERAGREGDQPLPEVGKESVFAAMRAFLDEREATGIRRYGRSLETFNARNACRDLREELLDGLVYATQVEMEHRAIVEALLVLAWEVKGVPQGAARDGALALAAKLEAIR